MFDLPILKDWRHHGRITPDTAVGEISSFSRIHKRQQECNRICGLTSIIPPGNGTGNLARRHQSR